MNNQRIKISDNFFLDEFLPVEFYSNLEKQLNIAQYIRTKTNQSCTINTWWKGGNLTNRGFRFKTTIGSPTSEHREMNAIDINIGNMTGLEMFNWVKENAKELYNLGVRRVEHPSLTPTWLHLDCKEHGVREIRVIDLKKVVETIKIL